MAFYDKFPYTNFQDLNLDEIMHAYGDLDRVKEEAEAYAQQSQAAADMATAEAATAAAKAAEASTKAAQAAASEVAARGYASSIEQTRQQIDTNTERIDNILVQGTPTEGNAELIDIRAGANGVTYATAGDAVRGQYTSVNNIINTAVKTDLSFEIGGLTGTGEEIANLNRARCGFMPVYSPQVTVVNDNPGYYFNVFWYDGAYNFLGSIGVWESSGKYTINNANMAYIRIVVKRTDDVNMDQADITTINAGFHLIANINYGLQKLTDTLSFSPSTKTYAVFNSSYVWFASSAVLPIIIPASYVVNRLYPLRVPKNTRMTISGPAQVKLYRVNAATMQPLYTADTGWIHDTTVGSNMEEIWYINVALYPTQQTGDIDNANNNVHIIYPIDYLMDTVFDTTIGKNYVMDSSFIRHSVKLDKLGTLTNRQAFCYYDGKYYSVAEDVISRQNSLFAAEATAQISIGHGNSLQLADNGQAYVCGWNDSKIYKVDLATMSVVNTYTLPLTGYTTGVVDENMIAYIFQRDSYPDTVDMYRFVKVDLTTGTVISTKDLPVRFGALQSCDYYEGRIIAVNGLGTSAVPNGFRVYDLDGNIIANYKLEVFDGDEPEGVFIDRDTGELLFSDALNIVLKANISNQYIPRL